MAAANAIISSLQDLNRQYIDQNLTTAQFYGNELIRLSETYYSDFSRAATDAIKYLLISYRQLVEEYDAKISDTRLGVDRAFISYYDRITYYLKEAIGLTWNEIQESETYVLGRIDSVESDIQQRLTTELSALDADLRIAIDAITVDQDDEVDSLWEEITRVASEIYDSVTGQITGLVNTVTTWVDELWEYVTSIMDWLSTRFNEFYTQITDWVTETLSSIRARITREVSGRMEHIVDYYERAKSHVKTAKAWLVSEIGRLGNTLRALIQTVISEVTDLLDDLAMLTDWRFAFFNLALSFPELGFLQVLNRDDETFNRFKPYWQALFARVMEED